MERNEKLEPHHAEERKIHASPTNMSSFFLNEKNFKKITNPIIIEINTKVNVKLPWSISKSFKSVNPVLPPFFYFIYYLLNGVFPIK